MRANSRVPTSAQTDIHAQLGRLLDRHAATPFRRPIADYNRTAFDESMARYAREGDGRPLILDSCCGVGESTLGLADAFPEHYVIGVDQSAARLARAPSSRSGNAPRNLQLVRADLVDYWRLLLDSGIRPERHYLLYPNPWPKIGHLSRRWHGHPVFPSVLALGGRLECRSNWPIYIDEFCFAVHRLCGIDVARENYAPAIGATPFERKYLESGHALYRARVFLPDATDSR